MHYVYVIQSLARNYMYIGITNNPKRRFEEHNNGYKKKTRAYLPFKMVYQEGFQTRIEARAKREISKVWNWQGVFKNNPTWGTKLPSFGRVLL